LLEFVKFIIERKKKTLMKTMSVIFNTNFQLHSFQSSSNTA